MSGLPPCVECRRQPADPRWRPFCSERCQLVDLGRWLQGAYRVPGPAQEGPAGPGDNDTGTDEDYRTGREADDYEDDNPQH